MPKQLKAQALHVLKVAIAFMPWIASMFVLYWLEYGQAWTTETPHRGKTSVAILVLGLGLSFFIQTYFSKRQKK